MFFAAAILGAILGSFINALSFRYNTGRSVLHGRSRCMRCGETLAWQHLVPVLSYLFLRGRCGYCYTTISWQYPLVELTAGVLAAGVYMLHPEPLLFVLHTAVWMTLLFITVYDIRHSVIPWPALGLLVVLALLSVAISQPLTPMGWWAGPALALPLVLFSLVSGGRWMGWADAPLELGLGWFLGLTAGGSALLIAFWVGACVGILLIVLNRAYTIRSELPFAPFLVLGAGCAYFFHVDLLQALPALFL